MNVKNINKFLDDIDKEKIVDWDMEEDCHKKIKKIKLWKETILLEKQFTETIQITLENNPHFMSRAHRHYGEAPPEKQWEVPTLEVGSQRKDEDLMEKAVSLPENVKRDLSKLLDEPLYDGRYYYRDGEKVRC